MSDNKFTVNSAHSVVAFCALIPQLFAKHKWVTFSWRIGETRSLDQNSLLHCWLTEFAAHLSKIMTKEVTPAMLEVVKKEVKGWCYRANGWEFMVYRITSPLTGKERTGYTSSTTWKRGEMFQVLSWLQMFAAGHGCVLESRGEFGKLQREQNQ